MASELRGVIDQESNKYKALTIKLNDALGEADGLVDLRRERDE